ncbi:ligase-associated DNA damage response endonuclease PdeM [Roseovarius sp. M141]|uniref:ligase-associated DNA damage response endonuclease PdeM n=1 Tax=Roseovarius sp. M141 TaxID=2583806 RepID=UPI0020CD39C2|nr:ligase-associated DNA damage response endonuclease PdeM [Roseovarius sp. M141]MCQ0091288.1 ligase-associated DNA damage response endonuclease PdeM [Roseovarius sp. M141]
MTGYPLIFAATEFIALGSGALFCPGESALILADLHLGKSERLARRGGALLPPFETRDTLTRLHRVIQETRPEQLFLLGDVFDDDRSRDALTQDDQAFWKSITDATTCTILAGNHDPSAQAEALFGEITLRHIAGEGPDISGHYHPKVRLKSATRQAFLVGQDHLILPAFGTYTGGLTAKHPTLTTIVGPGVAILTGARPFAVPYGQPIRQR